MFKIEENLPAHNENNYLIDCLAAFNKKVSFIYHKIQFTERVLSATWSASISNRHKALNAKRETITNSGDHACVQPALTDYKVLP